MMQIGMDHFARSLENHKAEEKWGSTPSHTQETINKPGVFVGKA